MPLSLQGDGAMKRKKSKKIKPQLSSQKVTFGEELSPLALALMTHPATIISDLLEA